MIGRKNISKQNCYLLSNLSDVFGQKVLWFWKPKRNVGCTVQIDQHICKIVEMKWRKPFMNRMEHFGYYGILNVISSTLQWSKYYWYITMRIQYIYWWILLVHCIPHDHDMREGTISILYSRSHYRCCGSRNVRCVSRARLLKYSSYFSFVRSFLKRQTVCMKSERWSKSLSI